jgi:hypothetical protein
MEVHFTPEQEAQLSQIASHAGTDTERLVKDVALHLLEQDARFRAAAKTQGPSTPLRSGRDDRIIACSGRDDRVIAGEGIAQADREEFIEEDGCAHRADA